MVWNEVFSKPNATTEPNAAQPGTIIQNWDGATSATTTSAGFATVVSEYKTLYLDQECCATGNSAAMPGNRIHQCYYVDIAEGVNKTSLVYVQACVSAALCVCVCCGLSGSLTPLCMLHLLCCCKQVRW